MVRRYTSQIRVWKEIKAILEEVAYRYDYVTSDLASSLLLEAMRNVHLLYYVLVEWFEVKPEEAKKTAREIAGYVEYLVKPVEEVVADA